MKMIEGATNYLKNLPRINDVSEATQYDGDVLLLPKNVGISAQCNSNVLLTNFIPGKDNKPKDLLRIIKIEDAFNVKYHETNILSPSLYVHSLDDKPWHITTQCILVTHLDDGIKKYIIKEDKKTSNSYGKHVLDKFWLPCSKPIDTTDVNDLVCVFNRRVSGWDGSIDRPVIELLGAGGHLQAIWDKNNNKFTNRRLQDNLKKEFNEEIGQRINENDIIQIGGFTNTKTHELVVLYCVNIDCKMIPSIQNFALGNIKEDVDGIYLGTFKEVIEYYKKDPMFFAGGYSALETNFPSNKKIVDRIIQYFDNKPVNVKE